MVRKANALFILIAIFFILSFCAYFALANTYIHDVYFNVPNTVYMPGERIELRGYVYQANFTDAGALVTRAAALSGAAVNLTIMSLSAAHYSNYTLTTDANGSFYSESNYFTSAVNVTAPLVSGNYYINAQYKPSNTNSSNISFSRVEIMVLNKTVDKLGISSVKANYNPLETVIINAEAIKYVGDRTLYVSNVSVNGSLRNSSKAILQSFSCTTGTSGKCSTSVTAPSTCGEYTLELSNFTAYNSFFVTPFLYNLYMKDDLGKSLKNTFSIGGQGRVEVQISNASDSEEYTFSGYIRNSSGSNIKTITSTTLNTNNSFTNSFLFTMDTLTFSYGAYSAYVTVAKTGGNSINTMASFQIEDWTLGVEKQEISSGFEYEYSTFPGKTLRLIALPTYRSNGSVLGNVTSSSFNILLKDNLGNAFASTNASWNSSCGKSGCYEFSLTAPSTIGKYTLYVTLAFNGDSQTQGRIINVIGGVISAQSTDKDGNIKELFGTNEYAYLSLSAYNSTSPVFNLSDAEIFLVSYMNGSDFAYTQTATYELVNSSNSAYEWSWNETLQRLKMDVPKHGGLYNVYLFGNNRTLGAIAKFIINPYDFCSSPKNTPGTVVAGTSYYIWQFKKTDTVYFDIKITQANNPLGKATASNLSSNGSGGRGSACVVDTQTKQVVSNATISIMGVTNMESGAVQNLNVSESTCQSSDSSGGYTCTVKPLSKWEGGQIIVKFRIVGQDGTSSIAYSRFEARAFYLYGSPVTWQNNPSSNITLSIQVYDVGDNWWRSFSGGISGTVSVKKVEYQGKDGEWLPTPVDSGYNVSLVNSSSITASSSSNTISIPVANLPGGAWPSGYYRVILQATTTAGDTDYGYAWFGIKLWETQGVPIECSATGCSYKTYFNSKENISLYITINKAGDNWWSGNTRNRDIYGNVTVGIKKIQDCRKWPCKDLNSTQYTAGTLNLNQSSSGYWWTGVNLSTSSKYILQINNTVGTWGTGYYSVILDINGTDTGYAWFNTIAFYVEASPTNLSGAYKYSIKNNEPMYFNLTAVKSYKNTYYYSNATGSFYTRYNESDYINVTLYDAVFRTWDPVTWRQKEYNYPEDINLTPSNFSKNILINVSFLNGNWPSGYYSGEMTLKNAENETSTGWLWFNVQPFRVSTSLAAGYNSWSLDYDQCINFSVSIYDPDWYTSTLITSNYTITSIYENIWNGYTSIPTYYYNYTNNTFNSTANITICPNSGTWGSGSWGGWHYLNILVKENITNNTQTGWLSFRTIPFSVTWAETGGNRLTNANVNVTAALKKPTNSSANAVGRLIKIYQWRYNSYTSTREEYIFRVGNASTGFCYSNVSGNCTVNGTQSILIYAPSGGWNIGSNNLYALWTSSDGTAIEDWSTIYFDGRSAYTGMFYNFNTQNMYQYYFNLTENITIKLVVQDNNFNNIEANITSVEYALSGDSCSAEWCRNYVSSTFSPANTSSGAVFLRIKPPASNWTRGNYAIRATVRGSGGTAIITGGMVRVKDFGVPNITVASPVNNATYSSSFGFSANTDKSSNCNVQIVNYDKFYEWFCSGWNSTNSTNSTLNAATITSCNITSYNFNGSVYYLESVYNNWHYVNNITAASYPAGYISTGGLSHTFTFNTTAWPNNQHYGLNVWCYDEDYNYANVRRAFKISR